MIRTPRRHIWSSSVGTQVTPTSCRLPQISPEKYWLNASMRYSRSDVFHCRIHGISKFVLGPYTESCNSRHKTWNPAHIHWITTSVEAALLSDVVRRTHSHAGLHKNWCGVWSGLSHTSQSSDRWDGAMGENWLAGELGHKLAPVPLSPPRISLQVTPVSARPNERAERPTVIF
jgi:hypothetical protein